MSERVARVAVIGLLAIVLGGGARADSPCLSAGAEVLVLAEQGLGGTGLGMDPGGIGGTGRGPQGGIGGTGHSGMGGTGIFGTVTAFGSICVNGLRVHYDEDVTVLVDGEEGSTDDLAVGEVVWMEAQRRDGRLVTEAIAIHNALVGVVLEVDADARRLRVGEVWVEVREDVVLVDLVGEPLVGLEGQVVEVSGLPDLDGTLVASRIEGREAAEPKVGLPAVAALVEGRNLAWLSVEGYLSERIGPDRVRIAGLEFELPSHVGVDRNTRVWATTRVRPGRAPRVERLLRQPVRSLRPDLPERPVDAPTQRPLDRPDPLEPPAVDRGAIPRIERPERPERVLRPERPERPDRPERPEQPGDRPDVDVIPGLPVRDAVKPLR